MRRPSHTTVVAYLALFIAIGGTAVALPGRNTVNSGDIINGQVRSNDVRNEDLGSIDVANESLSGADLSDSSIGPADLGENAVASSEVLNNSLMGADVDEASFGTVPSAGSVDSKSIAELDYFSLDDGPAQTVMELHALKLVATCDGGNFEMTADATTAGGFIQSSSGAGDSQFQIGEAPIEVQGSGNDADFLSWQGAGNKIVTVLFAYREPGTQCSMKGMAIAED